MEKTPIHKGRFIIQEIKEESFESNIKLVNKHESLKNFRKFYITTNNSSASTLELPEPSVFVYELNTKEWKKIDIVFKKKYNFNDQNFYKIFKYISQSSSDNESIQSSKERNDIRAQTVSGFPKNTFVDDDNIVVRKQLSNLKVKINLNVNNVKSGRNVIDSQNIEDLNIKKIVNNYYVCGDKNVSSNKSNNAQFQLEKFDFFKLGNKRKKMFEVLNIERSLSFTIHCIYCMK